MSNQDLTLAVPGVIHVGKTDAPDGGVVTLGQSAGWIAPPGIREWSHELSLIARAELTEAVRDRLNLTLPENRIASSKHPLAHRAASTSPLLAVTSDVAPQLVEQGVRVHTVGFDRVTGGFMYFAEGGGEPVRVHGDLLEMLEPALASGSSNDDIDRHLTRFIDRLLQHFSNGLLTELGVEVANALPRLSPDARGLQGVDLDAFESEASRNYEKAKKHEEGAKQLAAALASANGSTTVRVPLFGEAKGTTQPAIDIVVAGSNVTLPARTLWVVSGEVREEAKPAAAVAATPKPAVATPKPAVATPKPVAAAAKPAAATAKPAAAQSTTTPKAAPVTASATKPGERTLTPAPGKIPAALAAKPAEPKPAEPKVAAPKVAEPKVAEPKPAPIAPAAVSTSTTAEEPATEAAEPAVVVLRPVAVIGIGEAPAALAEPSPPPAEAKPEPVVEAKPEPVVEAKPEPVVEAKPEPVVEAKPEPVVEAKPEPKAEPKPEPKAEPKPEPKAKAAEPAAEKKAAASERPAKPKAADDKPVVTAPAADPPKSNAVMFVIIALLLAAAVIYFVVLKK